MTALQHLSLKSLCQPRAIIFDPQKRDTVLDLGDLVAGKVDPYAFFEENYITEGMKTLLEYTFKRLEGKSEQGVFRLKQAMGGGKTHNLIALGLLAKHPELREKVMGNFYLPDPNLGEVKVIAFSGRETDTPYGLWGELAKQLGKFELFKDLYSPLQAPGQNAWSRLLAGERLLILLDELPPYFQYAHAVPIGHSNLSQVTATALSNLLVAIGRPGCEQVALVITDLAASYESGSAQIADVLRDFENETNRSAMSLEPVRLNSDEFYHILRKRLFESLPNQEQVQEVVQAYVETLRKAKQMDLISETPEEFGARLLSSYPFHPGIRDLYARFRENPGFQQTRGLIRLMRIMAAKLWDSGKAETKLLISAHDLDLNDQQIRTEVTQINNTLENAIAHDIASEGNSVAEQLDHTMNTRDVSDAARLLLMASLANVPNAVLGLSIPEIIYYLAEPGRDLARLKTEVLQNFATQAWYLHSTRDGKLYFKNVENLTAKLESLVKTYLEEQALKELRVRLSEIFEPKLKDVYQKLLIFPALDEIELNQDQVTLLIVTPRIDGLDPHLKEFYKQTTWKNRLAILTGTQNTYSELLQIGKRLRAIQHIIEELKAANTADNDPQMIQAWELRDRILQNFHSAVRETFTVLWYPTSEGLISAELPMQFDSNRYDGEEQIRKVLKEKMKFTDEINGDIFRKKCEARLFTQQSMPWNEIKRRAATNPAWQWHHPSALEDLKKDCVYKDLWREQGGFVDKGPFPPPTTTLSIQQLSRDDDTGEVTLRITPVHGDTIYWEVGGRATTASKKLEGKQLSTKELRISFLCVDSTGVHQTGEPVIWTNTITLKYREYNKGNQKVMELRAAPPADIRYTTDGSDPKTNGARYEGEFVIPPNASIVLAVAERDGIISDILKIDVSHKDQEVKIDPLLPATLRRNFKLSTTQETYQWLDSVEKSHGKIFGVTLMISQAGTYKEWLEMTAYEEKQWTPSQIREALDVMRRIQTEGQVSLECHGLHFPSGEDLNDWIAQNKITVTRDEVEQ
ncbi:DUF499 domain-containing protein [Thermanaerothrix sp. 4228-RoL]|uniref:DUF499 domain-containing protein n=1 Tax=Thermanaerothrix solaris TaxID=3058434 RepID=A0ABU3NIG7_9CHLR|nr:DUF499 domain-containing protein [Thermanaerothrix sp. 4228-RoL]MDT8896656.1 DUF499 domain-containing protein [Thermanaerothrix sp. 4228-RoL]